MSEDKILRLVLGDQLNHNHSWFRMRDDRVTYLLMEVRQETDAVAHHIQKVAAVFAAMRRFADRLRKKGHQVIYLRLDNPKNRQDFEANTRWLVKQQAFSKFEYLLPDDYRLDRYFADMTSRLTIPWESFGAEHFLTARDEVDLLFKGKKQPALEHFYRRMRRKHNILIENDRPVGGRWNFDPKNRHKYDRRVPLPPASLFHNDVADIVTMLKTRKVKTIGSIVPEKLIWPVTRDQSLSLLRHFCKNGLPHFGTYQDAMTEKDWVLFHSRLSFSLNTKMLSPMEVIQAVVQAWEEKREAIAIQQVEGFIRQVLGWREYVRGIYWAHMPKFSTMNFLGHSLPLPPYYWDGNTRMNCMHRVIEQSLTRAYAHHIQRLMVTGNFALLAGIDPDEVDRWYLGIYIDAFHWVELVNTRGMSQFADGGITGTKPYVSSANYINSMSDYCSKCYYDRKKRYGDRACPFNSLYWDFYNRHRDALKPFPRTAVMYRLWDKLSNDERSLILTQAEEYRARLDQL